MRQSKLVKGTLVLMGASLITKAIGFVNSIVLSRTLGAEGIGIIAMVIPIMGLTMTLTTLGMPTAVAKLVSESQSQGNWSKGKRFALAAIGATIILSVLVSLIILTMGKTFTAWFFTDERSYYSLIAMVPVIPIMAVSGVLRGYLQGRQNMTPLAISQIIEGIARIFFIYIVVDYLMPRGIEIAAAGAVLSSVVAELVSLFYIVFSLKRKIHHKYTRNHIFSFVHQRYKLLLPLFRIGIPLTGSQLIRSLLRVVQPIIITNSLAQIGLTPEAISTQYGMLTGFVMPLLFIPGFVNHSLGVSLVPAISQAHAQGNMHLIRRRLKQAIGIATLVGIPSTILLYTFAEPLLSIIYKAPEASSLLRLVAPFFFFQYFHTPLQSILIGMGKTNLVMINNVVPKCVTLALIYPLVHQFEYGIYGIGLSLSIGVVLETIFHILSLVSILQKK